MNLYILTAVDILDWDRTLVQMIRTHQEVSLNHRPRVPGIHRPRILVLPWGLHTCHSSSCLLDLAAERETDVDGPLGVRTQCCVHIPYAYSYTLAGPSAVSLVWEAKLLQLSHSSQAVASTGAWPSLNLPCFPRVTQQMPPQLRASIGWPLSFVSGLCRLVQTMVMKLDVHPRVCRSRRPVMCLLHSVLSS